MQHLLLPDDLRAGLPAVDSVWEGFETASVTGAGRDSRRLAEPDAQTYSRASRPTMRRPASSARARALERPGFTPAAAVRPLDAPARRVALPARRQAVSDRGRRVPGAQQRDLGRAAVAGRPELPAPRAAGAVRRPAGRRRCSTRCARAELFDDAVIVVTADHGASFRTGRAAPPGETREHRRDRTRPALRQAAGPAPGRVDDGAVRTIDVLPTIAEAAGVRLPWEPTGCRPVERTVDPAAPIDISHAGEPVLTTPLGSVLAKRRAREQAETRLLRARRSTRSGPRPELIGRRVASAPARADTAESSAGVAPFITGRRTGSSRAPSSPSRSTGVVEATTRVYRDSAAARCTRRSCRRRRCATGPNAITVLRVLAGGGLRPLAG